MHDCLYKPRVNRAQIPSGFPYHNPNPFRSSCSHVDPSVYAHARAVSSVHHSKHVGSSTDHTSLVGRRVVPLITHRACGKYGLFSPSIPRANMRVLAELWTFITR